MPSARRTITTVATLGTALAVAATTTAAASPAARGDGNPSGDRVLADGVGQPFQIARRHGTVFFADGKAGTINKVTNKGFKVVARVPGVSGLEFSRNGKTMAIASGSAEDSKQRVTLVRRHHRAIVANLFNYEQTVNPDQNVTYGVLAGSNAQCNAALAQLTGGQATYQGIKDSHPYQLAPLPGGAFAVAEAGGNAILRVGPGGGVSTIALLPRQPITLTTAQATGLDVPFCAGVTYAFEPVPTDVERGPGGSLLVSTLPGGPEDPSLGARGAVYRISKRGLVTKVAGGFLGATNLAVARGRVYVTELFSGKVTKLGVGGRFTRYTVPGAVSVEATGKHLYIGSMGLDPKSPGQVVRLPR